MSHIHTRHSAEISQFIQQFVFHFISLGMVYYCLYVLVRSWYFFREGSTWNGVRLPFTLWAGNETLRRGRSDGGEGGGGLGGRTSFGHLDRSEWLSFDRLWTWKNISVLYITELEDTVFLSALGKPVKAPNHPSNRMIGNSSSAFCGRQHSSLPLLTQSLLHGRIVWIARLTADPGTGYKVLDYMRSTGNFPVRVATWHVVYLLARQSPGSAPDGWKSSARMAWSNRFYRRNV